MNSSRSQHSQPAQQQKNNSSDSNLEQSYSQYYQYPLRSTLQPQKDPNQPRVYEFDDINAYSRINQPTMNQQKRKMITEKLQVDKKAQVIANARINKDNMMVKYKNNPFLDLYRPKTYKEPPPPFKEKAEFQYANKERMIECAERLDNYKIHDNIVNAMGELNQRQVVNPPKEPHLQRDYLQKVSKQLNDQMHNRKHQLLPGQVDQTLQQSSKQELTLTQILSLQDQNYYQKNQIEINIFQFMKNTHKPFLTKDVLNQFYFCHNSTIDKLSQFKSNTLRDISKSARNYITDPKFTHTNRLDHISSKELSFKISQLNLEDLLSVATGRFSPEIVYKTANEIELREDILVKSEISLDSIAYNDSTRNKKISFQDKQIQKFQIIDYLRLANNRQQTRYEHKCLNIYKDIEDQLQKKQKLTSHTIKDQTLHKNIDSQINQQVHFLATMDYHPQQTEKKIRNNKVHKNRHEKIKIKTLIQTIQLKNKEEEKIKILLDDHK